MKIQLNNTKNGQIAVITFINANENTVLINLFENYYTKTINKPKQVIFHKLTFYLSELFDKKTVIIEECYKDVLENNEYFKENFKLSEDEKNWLVKERPIRLFIKKEIILDALIKNSEFKNKILSEIMNNTSNENKYIFYEKDNDFITAYYNIIDESESCYNEILTYINNGDIILDNLNT